MTKDDMLKWLSTQCRVAHVIRLVTERKFSPEELDYMKMQMQPYVKMKAKYRKSRGA